MENEPRNVPVTKVILDVILLMCVGFPILFLRLFGEPFHRGFFCDDESIRHPYNESTVSSLTLYFVGMGLNCVVMILTEVLNASQYDTTVTFLGHKVPVWLWKVYCVVGVFSFGACCSQLTTDVMKYTIGRLRPHFYSVCEPDIDCSLPINKYKYHINFTCTNLNYVHNKRIMKDMRLSFPSGHSSFSMYTMLYFVIYLHARMNWDGSKLLKHTLQLLALLSSIFTAMTRVSDYKHHWSDVLSGLLIGAIVACVVSRYVSTLFTKNDDEYTTKPTGTELNNLNGNQSPRRAV